MKTLLGQSLSTAMLIFATTTGVWADHQHHHEQAQGAQAVFYVDARVIRAEPIYQIVETRGRHHAYPAESCIIEHQTHQRRSSSGGPAGAIIGGAIGAQIGGSHGRDTESALVGAIAGSLIGGVIGHEISHNGQTTQREIIHRCTPSRPVKPAVHRTLIGYDVRYRYNGREFSIQTDQHPGRYVSLQVALKPRLR